MSGSTQTYGGSNKNLKDLKMAFACSAYGRGTDFVCRDDGLKMNGGPSLDFRAAWLGHLYA